MKACAHCGRELQRKRYPGGGLESPVNFDKRRCCNQRCAAYALSTWQPERHFRLSREQALAKEGRLALAGLDALVRRRLPLKS